MAVRKDEDKSLEGNVVFAANGVPTTFPDDNGKDVEVTLSAHYSFDGKDYLPGDKLKVRPDTAASLRAAGYAVRED